jgi:gamma-glutamyltranspeptidase
VFASLRPEAILNGLPKQRQLLWSNCWCCFRITGYYTGPIAEAIVEALKVRGGVMELTDLAAHKTLEVDALCTQYK